MQWLVGLLITAGLIFGGTKIYRHIEERGYDQGYSEGYEDGYSEAEVQTNIVRDDLDALVGEYDSLLADYNELIDAVNDYIGLAQYQARQPAYCSSYTWGYSRNYTSTYCY